MEWYEMVLLILMCLFFGFAMGYMFRSSQSAADAEEREQEFFDAVMVEVKKRTPEEAARVGEILAKRMADDILRRHL